MIIVSVVSSVVVLVVGVAIGRNIWKNRYIQKKRRGKKILPQQFFFFFFNLEKLLEKVKRLIEISIKWLETAFHQMYIACKSRFSSESAVIKMSFIVVWAKKKK